MAPLGVEADRRHEGAPAPPADEQAGKREVDHEEKKVAFVAETDALIDPCKQNMSQIKATLI